MKPCLYFSVYLHFLILSAMSLQAVFFDVDGTLANTEKDGHRVAFNKAFTELKLNWQWDAAIYGELLKIAGGKERLRHFIETRLNEEVTKYDVIEIHKVKTRHYTELLKTGAIPLRKGIHRLLKELKSAGVRMAIVTTTTPANVEALLEGTLNHDSESFFEFIAAGDIVPHKKPAPDIYQYALDQARLNAGDCIAIEDSDNGIRAAEGAGLKTVITVNDYTKTHDFSKADLVVSDAGEPGEPFTVLSGNPFNCSMLDFNLLQKISQT